MRAHVDTSSPDATRAFGQALAAMLQPGDTLALEGPLGAGKTTLVRAIAEARGVDPAIIASPTFVIVHVYPTAPNTAPTGQETCATTDVVHVDAYRLTGEDDLDALGWDVLARSKAITIIEWADRLAAALHGACRLRIQITGEDDRRITLDAPDSWRPRMSDLRTWLAPGPPR